MGMNDKKQERLRILRQIDFLTEKNCRGCKLDGSDYCNTKCNIGNQLKELGNQLIDNTGKQEVIKQLLAKREDLNKTDIQKLLSLEVTNNEIRKALNLTNREYEELLIDLGLKERKKNMPRLSKITMTIDEFVQWRFIDNLSFKAIATKCGVVESGITYWKKIHADEIEKKKKELKIDEKAVKFSENTKKEKLDATQKTILKIDETRKPTIQKKSSNLESRVLELEKENKAMRELLRLWL